MRARRLARRMPRGFRPSPLPDTLLGQPFTATTAREAGVTPARLRAADLDSHVHGVRAPAHASDDLRMRCRMFAARLGPDVFFSHSTAARLYGAPLPMRLQRLPRLHVTVAAPARAPHASGLIGHSRVVVRGDVSELRDGIRVSSPTRVFLEMAGILALPDLVAFVDHLIRRGAPLCSLADLVERLEAGDRLTRRSILRAALDLADPGSESPPESVLRLILARCGWGRPETNFEVRSLDGRRMRIDLAFPTQRLAVEYHGDYHRDREQWRRDLARRSRLEALGWTVIELTADDLDAPEELVTRVQAIAGRAAS